jgi:hypothetical protein
MEEDGHPFQRHHHEHGLLIRADSLVAGVAMSSVTRKSPELPDAHCGAFGQTVGFELEAKLTD